MTTAATPVPVALGSHPGFSPIALAKRLANHLVASRDGEGPARAATRRAGALLSAMSPNSKL